MVFDDFVLAFFTSGVTPQPLSVRIYSAIRFGIQPSINAVGTLMLLGSILLIATALALPRLSADAAPDSTSSRADQGTTTMSVQTLTAQDAPVTVDTARRRARRHLQVVRRRPGGPPPRPQIGAGEFFSMLGPSGCGKTTTLRMIGGFVDPTAGAVLLHGHDVTDLPPNRRDVNTVFQSYALFDHLSIWDNVAFGLRRQQGRQGRDEAPGRRDARAGRSSPAATRTCRGRFPAASGSGSRWRGRWSTGHPCCSSTSRWRPWTSSCARRCRSSSSGSSARSASPSSSSRTTRTRR